MYYNIQKRVKIGDIRAHGFVKKWMKYARRKILLKNENDDEVDDNFLFMQPKGREDIHTYGHLLRIQCSLQICKPNCPTRSGSKSHFRAYHRASSMRKQNGPSVAGHWIAIYYSKRIIHVYDSANKREVIFLHQSHRRQIEQQLRSRCASISIVLLLYRRLEVLRTVSLSPGRYQLRWVGISVAADHMGVPQGSVLGPLLFSLFMNDLPEDLVDSRCMLFADDLQVLQFVFSEGLHASTERFQSQRQRRFSWATANGLSLNRAKTQVGKSHPDLYSLIREFQKEQGDTEIGLIELSNQRRIKSAPKKKWVDVQRRLRALVETYDTYGLPQLHLIMVIIVYVHVLDDTAGFAGCTIFGDFCPRSHDNGLVPYLSFLS
ncbi:unnamed protein product [Trichogramma brassicae]|uniref:Reverse transcriptase domain-containing protein n=1 Tax=Trichogramma brassicae TaxID=86971 RepID=A0A6H5IX02_9HYME|nr:unnamed protein product [Trichogramma brassicae]